MRSDQITTDLEHEIWNSSGCMRYQRRGSTLEVTREVYSFVDVSILVDFAVLVRIHAFYRLVLLPRRQFKQALKEGRH